MISALVIDDEEAFRHMAVSFLSDFCLVKEAATTEEGYRLFESSRPDIIVVDNQFPDGSGTNLVRRIRERDTSTFIVMITVDKEEVLAPLLAQARVELFLKKPFRREDLEACLLKSITEIKKTKGAAGGQAENPRC